MTTVVEIFKTNVRTKKQANNLLKALRKNFPALQLNFDLEDCDKILRVQGENIPVAEIIPFLQINNFNCEVLN